MLNTYLHHIETRSVSNAEALYPHILGMVECVECVGYYASDRFGFDPGHDYNPETGYSQQIGWLFRLTRTIVPVCRDG